MPTTPRKTGSAKPAPAKPGKKPQGNDNFDVSIEDRGYDPYDVTPRDDDTRRRQRDKWSF